MATQTEGSESGLTAKRLIQIGRITVSVLSMGFIFPHAIADGLNVDDGSGVPVKTNKS